MPKHGISQFIITVHQSFVLLFCSIRLKPPFEILNNEKTTPSHLLVSCGAWADCEDKYKKPTDVVACYENESFQMVKSKLKELTQLSQEQLSYNPNVIKELNKSHAAWIAYRDSYCDSYSNYHTEMNNHANCIISLNNDRVKQLDSDIEAN